MFKIFKNRNFLLLWGGQTISGIGNWINFVGLNLFVLKTFGSGSILGLFLVVRMLPSFLFGSVGGYLADKYNRKTLMLVCDSLRALIVLGFLFTHNIYVFFILGLLLSALDKIFMSARGSFVPQIVEKKHLMEANALNEMTSSIMTIVGPAIGALLVSCCDFRAIFITDSATFVVSVACLLLISYKFTPEQKKPERPGIIKEFIDEYKVAFGFMREYTPLLFLLLLRFIDAIGSGAYNIALPIYSKSFTHLNLLSHTIVFDKGAAFGWLVGIWALGQFSGSFLTRKITKIWKISQENLFSIAIGIMAIGMGLAFHFPTYLASFVAIFLGGIGDGMSNVIFVTMVMRESPEKIRGKLFGTIFSLIYSAVAVGMIAGGWFIDSFPLITITNAASFLILIGISTGRYLFYLRDVKKRTSAGEAA